MKKFIFWVLFILFIGNHYLHSQGQIFFNEDFENPGFIQWDEIKQNPGVILECIAPPVNFQGNSLAIDFQPSGSQIGYIKKNLGRIFSEFYLRVFICIDPSFNLLEDDEIFIIDTLRHESGRDNIAASLLLKRYDGSRFQLVWMNLDNQNQYTYIPCPQPIMPNHWYCLELKYLASSEGGGIETWLNGSYQAKIVSKDNSLCLVNTLYVGALNIQTTQPLAGKIYFDAIVLANQAIGMNEPFVSKIGISPEELNVETTISQNSVLERTIEIFNEGGSLLNWEVSENIPWLTVTPLQGQNSSFNNSLNCSINLNNLTIGNYTGNIIITNSDHSEDQKVIPVNLSVNQNGSILFREKFRDDGFIKWDRWYHETGIGMTATTSVVNEGTHALEINYPESLNYKAYLEKDLGSLLNEIYWYFDLYIDANFMITSSTKHFNIAGVGYRDAHQTYPNANLVLEENAEGELFIYWNFRTGTNQWTSLKPVGINRGEWVRLEGQYTSDHKQGGLNFWVNGDFQDGNCQKDTASFPIHSFYLGSLNNSEDVNTKGNIYFDHLILADNRPGVPGNLFLPQFRLSEAFLVFESNLAGDFPVQRPLIIGNSGGGLLEWEIRADQQWIHVTPAQGIISNASNRLMVGVDTTTLPVGINEGTLILEDKNNPSNMIEIPIVSIINPFGTCYWVEDFQGQDFFQWNIIENGNDVDLTLGGSIPQSNTNGLIIQYHGGDQIESYISGEMNNTFDDIHFRCRFFLDDSYNISQFDSLNHFISLGYKDSYRYIPTISMSIEKLDQQTFRLFWTYFSEGSLRMLNIMEAVEIKKNRWYCMEIHYKADAQDGGMEFWLDGIPKAWFWGRDTADYPINSLSIGSLSIDNGATVEGSVYFDDIALGSGYMGCDTPYISKLGLTKDDLNFEYTKDSNRELKRTFGLYNAGGAELNWTAEESIDWLSLSPMNGMTSSQLTELNVKLTVDSLTPGSYTGNITFRNADYPEDQKILTITLNINEAGSIFFLENFEAGNLDQWQSGTPPPSQVSYNEGVFLDISNQYAYEGTKSLGACFSNLKSDPIFIQKDLEESLKEIYVRFYLYLGSDFVISETENQVNVMALGNSSTHEVPIAAMLMIEKGEGDQYKLRPVHFAKGDKTYFLNDIPISKGQWIPVEIRYVCDELNGGMEYWIDGIYQGGNLAQDTSSFPVSFIKIGSLSTIQENQMTGCYYFDDLFIGDRHIGISQPFLAHISAVKKQYSITSTLGDSHEIIEWVDVYNQGGGGNTAYYMEENSSWLSIDPIQGILGNSPKKIKMTILPQSLNIGTYTTDISIFNSQTGIENERITLQLEIINKNPLDPDLETDLTELKFKSSSLSEADLTQSLILRNTGGSLLNWQSTFNQPWLSLNPESGTLPAGQELTIEVTVNLTQLFLGVYHDTITLINSDHPQDKSRISVVVTPMISEGFEPGEFNEWTVEDSAPDCYIDLVTGNSMDGNTALKIAFTGDQDKKAYIYRSLGAVYSDAAFDFYIYIDPGFSKPANDDLPLFRVGNFSDGNDKEAVSLTISDISGGIANLLCTYWSNQPAPTSTSLLPRSISIGQWQHISIRYSVDHLNGGVEWSVNNLEPQIVRGLNTIGFDLKDIQLGSLTGNIGHIITGDILIDQLQVTPSIRPWGLKQRSLQVYGSTGHNSLIPQIIDLFHYGANSLIWSASADVPWISLSATTGEISNCITSLEFQIDTTGLSSGSYLGQITISDANNPGDQEILVVQLIINEEGTIYYTEDFETGNLDKWIITDDSPNIDLQVTEQAPKMGNQSLRVEYQNGSSINPEAYIYHQFQKIYDEFYLRVYLYLDNNFEINTDYINNTIVSMVNNDGFTLHPLSSLRLYRAPGDHYFISVGYTLGTGNILLAPAKIDKGNWNCIELHYRSDQDITGMEYWVNGHFMDRDFQQTVTQRGLNFMLLGSLGIDPGGIVNGGQVFDEILLADTHIGGITPFTSKVAIDNRYVKLEGTGGKSKTHIKKLQLFNAGGDSLSFTIQNNNSWLKIEPLEGEVTQDEITLTIFADISTVAPGNYTTTFTIVNQNDPSDTEDIQVELTVNSIGTSYFREDFESQDFSQWEPAYSGTDVDVAISNQTVAEGNYGSVITYRTGDDDSEYYFHPLGEILPESFLRFYFYVDTNFTLDEVFQSIYPISLGYQDENSSQSAVTFTIEKFHDPQASPEDSDKLYFYWTFFYENGQWSYLPPHRFEKGQWYVIELHYVPDAQNGRVEYWINGEYQGGVSGQDFSGYPINTIYYGSLAADPNANPVGDIYFDNILLADTHIGTNEPYRSKLGVSANTVLLKAQYNGFSEPRDISIFNFGGGVLNWTASTSTSWLNITPAQGQVIGQNQIITLQADVSGLTPGEHQGQIQFINDNDATDSLIINVDLHVYSGGFYFIYEDFNGINLDSWMTYGPGTNPQISLVQGQSPDLDQSLKINFLNNTVVDESFIYQETNHQGDTISTRFNILLDETFEITMIDAPLHIFAMGYKDDYSFIPTTELMILKGQDNKYHGYFSYFEQQTVKYLDDFVLEKGTRYCVEIESLTDGYNGYIRYWIDGIYQDGKYHLGTQALPVTVAGFGSFNAVAQGLISGSVFVDDLIVGTQHVGCKTPFTPSLTLEPQCISFKHLMGSSIPLTQEIDITNSGGGSLNWEAHPNPSWITLNKTNGVVNGNSDTLTVTLNPNALVPRDNHRGIIHFNNQDDPLNNHGIIVNLALYESEAPLFKENFDKSNFLAWDDIINPEQALSFSNVISHSGEYALQVTHENGIIQDHYLNTQIQNSYSNINLQFALYLGPNFSISQDQESIDIIHLLNKTFYSECVALAVSIERINGSYYLSIRNYISVNHMNYLSPFPLNQSNWNNLQITYRADEYNGGVELIVDGTPHDHYWFQNNGFYKVNKLKIGTLGKKTNIDYTGSFYLDSLTLKEFKNQ